MSDVTGVISYRGIEYAAVPGFRPLELDLYLPGGLPGPVPVVVHVHGGGWRRGSRRHPLPALGDGFYHELAATGIAVAAIDYRLSGEARYPAAVDDVRAAVAWARTALPGYGVTPGPLALLGDSAGGHLALLAALTAAPVDGVVAWFPVTDLTTMHQPDDDDPHSREALFLGAPPSQVPDLARAASPVSHVHAGAPPVLVMHGDSDTMVPASQSTGFAQALADAGGTVTLELVPGASHFWDGAGDVPGIVARSAGFVRSLAPGTVTATLPGRSRPLAMTCTLTGRRAGQWRWKRPPGPRARRRSRWGDGSPRGHERPRIPAGLPPQTAPTARGVTVSWLLSWRPSRRRRGGMPCTQRRTL